MEDAGRDDGVLKIMPPLTIDEGFILEELKIVKKNIVAVLFKFS